jgi:hypothetical protein
MKRFTLALSVLAVLSLTACAYGTNWTPMSGGRTAGAGMENKNSVSHKADKTFNKAMHK